MLVALNRARSAIQLKHIWWLLVAAGILQRLRQYIANRSLWADEASLALNIVNRSFAALSAPLDGNQGAPLGFLWIQKLFVVVLGNHDYVLRLFPLVCSILAVYLMHRIAHESIGTFGLVGLLMFNLSWPLINYSSELKQYGIDVAVALFIAFYALRFVQEDANRNDFVGLITVGIFSMWLSHPSVFILASVGMVLMYRRLTGTSSYPIAWFLLTGAAWLVNLWLIYSISLNQLAANDYLQQFWRAAFLPLPPWKHWDWLGEAFLKLLSTNTGIFRPLPWYFVVPCAITIFCGLIPAADSAKSRFMISLILITVLLVLTASALHLYPVQGRFLLFLAPFAFLLMANGLKQIYHFVGKGNVVFARLLIFLLILGIAWKPAVLTLENLVSPPLGEHIKPVLAHMQENRQDTDIIYVYYGGLAAFDYYRASFGLDSANVVDGVMSREDPEKYIQDIDMLKGHDRVWFVFTHNCDTCIVHEQKHYLRHLNKIGTVISRLHAPGANLYLYDLNP